jgi:hypothetical protein
MKRYFSSFMGMKESEKGEWVEYSRFEEERLLLEELAASRLDMIHTRNTEIIRMKKESEESHIKYQKIIDSLHNQNNSFQGFVSNQDKNIYKIQEANKKLQLQSKCADLKHDIFIFSVVLNIVFTVFTTINAFGGIL